MTIFKNNLFILRYVHRVAPGRLALQTFQHCFSLSFGAFYTLIFFRYLINAYVYNTSATEVIVFILFFCGYEMCNSVFGVWFRDVYCPKSDLKIQEALVGAVMEKAVTCGIAAYENSEEYDIRTKAMTQASEKSIALIHCIADIFSVIFALCLNVGFAAFVEPGILAVAVLPIFLLFVAERRKSAASNRLETDHVPYTRRAEYVKRTFYLADYAHEMRLTGISRVMLQTLHDAADGMRGNIHKHGVRIAFLRFLSEFATQIFLYISLYAYIAVRFVSKSITLGDFSSLSGAVVNFAHFVQDLAEYYGNFCQLGLYAEHFQHFMTALDPIGTGGDLECCFKESIEFHDVVFTYPGQNKPALRGVTFRIEKGQIAALAGCNGAGKTTIVKLLLRLYDVDSGEIRIDGVPIQQYQTASLRRQISCAVQNFHIYALTAAENVHMRRVTPAEFDSTAAALDRAGLAAKITPDEPLTREFDPNGRILSGGEQQKLAAARVFASDAPIAVLDEPSSALDPIRETELFHTLYNFAEDNERTVLFVSHRLSSVQRADQIIVLDKGKTIAAGSHIDLMASCPLYAEMFIKQASYYQEETFHA